MKTLYIPITEGRPQLCGLLDKAQAGVRVVFTAHGKPKAELSAYRETEGRGVSHAEIDLSDHLAALADAGFTFEPSAASQAQILPCRF